MELKAPAAGAAAIATGSETQWQAIWQLVRSAEHRPLSERQAWLSASTSDPFVIRKVLEILEASTNAATAQTSLPAPQGKEEEEVSKAGMRMGRYRVGSLLGTGGAGSVYAGFDEALDRAVALKFLARQRAGDRERIRREARAASALNHPNIVMIHEVVEEGADTAMVMELVEGTTMRERLKAHPPLDEAIRWSLQLAQALSAAHAHGLVHGDLKPENVVIREDGYVKLLDFGLAINARLAQRGAGGGAFAGTPRYMSPERWQGGSPTAAGDIFAFGVMLYEAASGRFPFEAANGMSMIQAAAVAAEPERLRGVPEDLNRLIRRMLAHNPAERPEAAQVSAELAKLAHRFAAGGRGKRLLLPAAAAAVLVMAAFGGALAWWRNPSPPASSSSLDLSKRDIHPVASQSGIESKPSLSADGKLLSCLYQSEGTTRPHLQIYSTQSGLLRDIDPGALYLESPAAWSADSKELAFIAREPQGTRSIFRVPAEGGEIRKWVEFQSMLTGYFGFDWSPDGQQVVMIDAERRADQQLGMYVWEPATGKRRTLVPAPVSGRDMVEPRFSPDGKWIVFERVMSFTASDLYVVPTAGGPVRRLTQDQAKVYGFGWTADGRVVFISSRNGMRALWSVGIDGNAPVLAAASTVGRTAELTLSRRGRAIAWVADLGDSNLWRTRIRPTDGKLESVEGSSSLEYEADWSKAGLLAYRSDRSGTHEIWISRADGADARRVTSFKNDLTSSPHWSPDGRHLTFTAHVAPNGDIFSLSCDPATLQCSDLKRLTTNPFSDSNSHWSADGKYIYFNSNRGDGANFEVWRIPAGGGDAVQITKNRGYCPRESPDGKWLYYSKLTGQFYRAPIGPQGVEVEREEKLVDGNEFWVNASYTVSDRELFYPARPSDGSPGNVVRALDLATRRTREISSGGKALKKGLSISPDGQWLLMSSTDRIAANVMVAE